MEETIGSKLADLSVALSPCLAFRAISPGDTFSLMFPVALAASAALRFGASVLWRPGMTPCTELALVLVMQVLVVSQSDSFEMGRVETTPDATNMVDCSTRSYLTNAQRVCKPMDILPLMNAIASGRLA